MAIGVNGGNGGGRKSRGVPAMAEINVTPFVDVVLVLLIIFMITAHAMESGIEIDVPKTKSVATSAKELPVVSLSKNGDIHLGDQPVNINRLVDAIHSKYPGQQAVYLRADREAMWDIAANVMSVMGTAKLAVNVVTEPEERTGARR
jgi:biopolymer transport protein ExbD